MIPDGRVDNAMAAADMGLDHGKFGIHETNNPSSVGRFVSCGCIRMHKSDFLDLYRRVLIETPVMVLP